MKFKIVVETVGGTSEEDKALITLETNSTTRAGAFVRDRISKFDEPDPNDILERVVSIEKDGQVMSFGEDDWIAKATKWLQENDWF